MNGKHITKLGFTHKSIGLALAAAQLKEDAGLSRQAILDELSAVRASPAAHHSSEYAALVSELLVQQAHTELQDRKSVV